MGINDNIWLIDINTRAFSCSISLLINDRIFDLESGEVSMV
jgi:hypothetical protein